MKKILLLLVICSSVLSIGCKVSNEKKNKSEKKKGISEDQLRKWITAFPKYGYGCNSYGFSKKKALFNKNKSKIKPFLLRQLDSAKGSELASLLQLLTELQWAPMKVARFVAKSTKSFHPIEVERAIVNFINKTEKKSKKDLTPIIKEAYRNKYVLYLALSGLSTFPKILVNPFMNVAKSDYSIFYERFLIILASKWYTSKPLLEPLSKMFLNSNGKKKKWASEALALQGPRAEKFARELFRYACSGNGKGGRWLPALGVNAMINIQKIYLSEGCKFFDFADELFRNLGPEGSQIIPFISKLAQKGKNFRIRGSAVDVLGASNSHKAVPVLISILRTKQLSYDERMNAVIALGNLKEKSTSAMPSIIKELRSKSGKKHHDLIFKAIGSIRKNSRKAIPFLIRSILQQDQNANEAIDTLLKISKTNLIPTLELKKIIKEKKHLHRTKIAFLLFKIERSKETISILRKALSSLKGGKSKINESFINVILLLGKYGKSNEIRYFFREIKDIMKTEGLSHFIYIYASRLLFNAGKEASSFIHSLEMKAKNSKNLLLNLELYATIINLGKIKNKYIKNIQKCSSYKEPFPPFPFSVHPVSKTSDLASSIILKLKEKSRIFSNTIIQEGNRHPNWRTRLNLIKSIRQFHHSNCKTKIKQILNRAMRDIVPEIRNQAKISMKHCF